MTTERKSVAEAMSEYCTAAQRYQDYLDRNHSVLPHVPTLTRLGNAMRKAERDVDTAILALIAAKGGGG
jgi:hypothetical protein